jgi:NADH-quinone oxidoreductase subunit G
VVAAWFRGAGAGANDSMVLLSPVSPTETLFAAKQLAREVLHTDRVVGTGTRPPGVEDRILRRADPYPNTAGLELLGLAGDPVPALEAGGGLLVIIDDDPMGQRGELASRLEKFERVVYLGSNECATSRAARLSLPIAPHSECEGTFVNFQGRVQRFRKAIIPRGDALWAPELLRRLAEGAGKPPAWRSPAELWGRLASAEAEFEGIDYARLGDGGVLVSSRRSAHVVPSGIGGGNG